MAGLTPAHLLLILIIALIVVGPGKLPEVGAAIGKSVREFQKATSGVQDTLTGTATPQAPQAQVQAPAQPYYAAQPPVQYYQPVVGVVQPAPLQPTLASYPQPSADVDQPAAAPYVD